MQSSSGCDTARAVGVRVRVDALAEGVDEDRPVAVVDQSVARFMAFVASNGFVPSQLMMGRLGGRDSSPRLWGWPSAR